MQVIVISLVIHGIAGLIATVWTVRNIIIKDATFEEPPQEINEEPPPDVKVVVEPEQQPDQFENQLKMPKLADIAIEDVDLPEGDEGAFVVASSFGSFGAGAGLISGGAGGLGLNLTDASIFGLKTKAERFLILIDANRRMLSDEKGGLNSYKVIKDEVARLVSGFAAGTLFNVIFYDKGRMLSFKPKLVPAGTSISEELKEWIDPVNSDAANVGILGHPRSQPIEISTFPDDPVHVTLPHIQWDGNQVGYATQLALEQNADAIFMITGYHRGFEDLRRPMNEEEKAKWEIESKSGPYQQKLTKHEAEIPKMRKRIEEELDKINRSRKSNGQPPRILKDPSNIYKSSQELGLGWDNPHPGDAPSFEIDIRSIEKYFERVVEYLYAPPEKPPSIYVVLFLTEDEQFSNEWESQLKKYVRLFKGRHRIIRGANELKRASTAVE